MMAMTVMTAPRFSPVGWVPRRHNRTSGSPDASAVQPRLHPQIQYELEIQLRA